LKIGYVPYGWLIPQMAALVHHGGAGTTALALRAGIPMTIVPFTFDQFYWGKRIQDLGVGPPAIPFRQLRADRLAEAISKSVLDQRMKRGAGDLGIKIQAEDSIRAAIDVIENYKSREANLAE
jgi:UDP:flavonoid glycosyltransferase YjiC (YdhE family)